MTIAELTDAEAEVAHAALRAIAEGPLLADGEMHARVGLTRDELVAILNRWPDLDDEHEQTDDWLAINNCLNEICHGLRFDPQIWTRWFDVPRDEVKRVFALWRGDTG